VKIMTNTTITIIAAAAIGFTFGVWPGIAVLAIGAILFEQRKNDV